MNFSEILTQAIVLAKQAHEARENRDDDEAVMVDEDGIPLFPEDLRLDTFFKAQPPPVIYMLTAVMYLGRGDFKVKALRRQYEDISESFGGKELAARLMFGKWVLPEYLEAGQKALSRAHVDVDKLLAD